MINTVKPEPAGSSTGPVYESGTVSPQKWATGTGTVGDPWANDCIKSAYDNVPAGGTIFLKAGYYQLAGRLLFTKQVNIIGEGRNKTIIITANDYGFDINSDNGMVDYVTLKGFTIDGAAQTEGGAPYYRSTINIDGCDYAFLEDIEVKNAGDCGINLFEVNHSSFQNIYAHDNWEHGIHSGSDTAGRNMYNTYRDIYAWDNGENGFDDRGSIADPELQRNNVYDNIQTWGNTQMGIALTVMGGGSLINSSAYDNGLYGIYLGKVYDFTIENCSAYSNYEVGIRLYECDNINLSNVIVKNNNTSDQVNVPGIYIGYVPSVKLSNCQIYDDRAIPLQTYAIIPEYTTKYIEIINCKLTPNKTGTILDWTFGNVVILLRDGAVIV
jgi:parallel beta-helix repeat protein